MRATTRGSRLVARSRRSVGRGLDPAANPARCPYTVYRLFALHCRGRMYAARARPPYGNVFGKGAKPTPALQDSVLSLAIPPSFLTGQKGSEKAAANSEARGTAKGACGPLWKPRRSNVVARDGFRFSQGKGSLLQYPFYLPVRLIQAPVLKPRPRSQAGKPGGYRMFTQ